MSLQYQLILQNRNSPEYQILETSSDTQIELDIHPAQQKLCNKDIFTIDSQNNVEIIESPIRDMEYIAGILILQKSKTYGKIKQKHLYKCLPADKTLPAFLVPYKPKANFSKNKMNKYIIFKFKEWNGKHPIGTILNTIGNTNDITSFYQYQLYSKNIFISLQKFKKQTVRTIKQTPEDILIQTILPKCLNKLTDKVFSIDPLGSRDFDDAFSITREDGEIRINIYIANVAIWLDHMDLWDSFANQVATIYLPNGCRSMLPSVLADNLCSLQRGKTRFALELSMLIENGIIMEYNYSISSIKVRKNYVYESPEMLADKQYQLLLDTTRTMNQQKSYMDEIRDSHDVVAYLMITMNYISAIELNLQEIGIFRNVASSISEIPNHIPSNVQKFLKHFRSSGGTYSCEMMGHDIMTLDAYTHITSPIRRLVDLLNIMSLQDKLGLYKMSENSQRFYERWIKQLDVVNIQMKSIRKVQNNCAMLDFYNKMENDVYSGYVVNVRQASGELYKYTIYFPSIKKIQNYTSRNPLEMYSKYQFKIYMFQEENEMEQKIKLELV